MKKYLLAGVLALAFMSSAYANKGNNNNPPVNINGNAGSVQISQCASVAGNCNNPDMEVNFNGSVDTVYVDGKATVIKGSDGKDGLNGTNGTDGVDGKDGINGLDGAKGDQGNQGEQGLTGASGSNGLDGLNGKNGKDADMSVVNGNTKSIKALEKSTNQRFAALQNQVDDNRKHASAGVAGAGAMANIPQVSQNSKFSMGAGIGGYDGESALAVGMSARFNDNIVTKASVAMTTQDDAVWGAGVSYEW